MSETIHRNPGTPRLRPYRFTRTEVEELCELGWFQNSRLFLLHGQIYERITPSPQKCYAMSLLEDYLRPIVPDTHHLRQHSGLPVGKYTEPVPEFSIATGTYRDYSKAFPKTALLSHW
jgi:hypothetical protein